MSAKSQPVLQEPWAHTPEQEAWAHTHNLRCRPVAATERITHSPPQTCRTSQTRVFGGKTAQVGTYGDVMLVKGIAMSEGFGRNSVVRGSFGPPSLLCAQIQGLGSLNSQDAVEAWLGVTIGSFKEMVSVPASQACRVVCVVSRAPPRRLVLPRGAGDAAIR